MSNYKLLLEKNKDRDWWKKVFQEYVPYGSFSNNREGLLMLYGIVNNDVSYIQQYMETLHDPTDGLFRVDFEDKLSENTIMYNKIFPKYEYHVNQIKNRVDNYEIVPHNEIANEFKKEEFDKVVSQFTERKMVEIQEIQNKILSQELNEAEANSKIQEILSEEPPSYQNFTSTLEQFLSDILDYFHFKFPVKQLKELTARHVLCSDIIAIGIVDRNEPEPVIFNPINIDYLKNNEDSGIENSQYFSNKQYVLLTEAYNNILQFGTSEDLEIFKSFKGSSGSVDIEANSFDSIKKGHIVCF